MVTELFNMYAKHSVEVHRNSRRKIRKRQQSILNTIERKNSISKVFSRSHPYVIDSQINCWGTPKFQKFGNGREGGPS